MATADDIKQIIAQEQGLMLVDPDRRRCMGGEDRHLAGSNAGLRDDGADSLGDVVEAGGSRRLQLQGLAEDDGLRFVPDGRTAGDGFLVGCLL